MNKDKQRVKKALDACFKVNTDYRCIAALDNIARTVLAYDQEKWEKINDEAADATGGLTHIDVLPFEDFLNEFDKTLKRYCKRHNCMQIYEAYKA